MIDVLIFIVLALDAFIFYWSGYDDCYIDFLKGKFKDEQSLIKLKGDDKNEIQEKNNELEKTETEYTAKHE